MAATRRKKKAKAPAKAKKPKTKAKRGAKTGLLSSLAQYVKKKASGLVKRTKKRRAKKAPKAKATPAPT
ncbi:MAG TPA: hypothetical protein VIV11_32680 [Kofleriaceae bacterium]